MRKGALCAPLRTQGEAVTGLRYSPGVLTVHARDGLEPLVAALAGVLAEPLDDPMVPEWIAVPSAGTERWMRLALARRLGTAAGDGTGAGDGVAANITSVFPARLRDVVLAADPDGVDGDPWSVTGLTWALLDVLDRAAGAALAGPAGTLAPGATRYGRARRIADLFDRYGVHRPEMVRNWARQRDVDAAGDPLPAGATWQPHLWRQVREHIGVPSPAERLPELLRRVATGELELDLPPRLSLFGVSSIPGGTGYLDVLLAVAGSRDVHLFLLCPSPALVADAVRDVEAARPESAWIPRGEDPVRGDAHALLRSWARPSRDAAVLLAAAGLRLDGLPPAAAAAGPEPPAAAAAGPEPSADPAGPEPSVGASGAPAGLPLLARLQADLRSGRPSGVGEAPGVDDRSIQVHACHGPGRQVEVLRDAILHLLADDPTLSEDDIVVLTPDIDTFGPLVEATFGAPATPWGDHPAPVAPAAAASPPPRLRYVVTDRSLRATYPTFAALAVLVDLLGSRFRASATADFLALAPVRQRFGFDDDALSTINGWIESCAVRWGLDGDHRAGWALDPTFVAGTWRTVLDRLLVGVAATTDDLALAVGGILPEAVEGTDIALAGRLADVIGRLASLAADASEPRPAAAWCALLGAAADDLFAAPFDAPWQMERLHEVLDGIAAAAGVPGRPSEVDLTLADVRRLLVDHLSGVPRRPDFFRCGVTVSSLTPLRGVPFRVVCLLGMDDTAFGGGAVNGDDLVAAAPHVGDRDERADRRQALLEAVLAAGEHLVITRTGHNVVTNLEVPPCTPLAELLDAVAATVTAEARKATSAHITVVHPRQAFDPRAFIPGHFVPGTPWGFDGRALAGAVAVRGPRRAVTSFVTAPLAVGETPLVELADLRAVLRHPVREFLRRTLAVRLPDGGPIGEPVDDLPVSLIGLDKWLPAERLLALRAAGAGVELWSAREWARGSLPAGGIGDGLVTEISSTVEELLAVVDRLGGHGAVSTPIAVDVTLPDGTRVVGSVTDHGGARRGPLVVSFSQLKAKQRLDAWIDLIAAVATDPERPWQAAAVGRRQHPTKKDGATKTAHLLPSGADPEERRQRAVDALVVVVDLYRRALREPLPFFPDVSALVHQGKAAVGAWAQDPNRFDDSNDAYNDLVYGHLDASALVSLPSLDHDPPGPSPFRVQRYADTVWGAYDASVEPGEADQP